MRIGPYELQQELARGGMGVVYRAHDHSLNRAVAVKVITLEPGDAEFQERFQREAQAAARLKHPSIVGVHACGVVEGRAYLVMDLVEGESLSQRLKSGPLAVEEAVRLAIQLAEAVESAHEHGVLHRDLKPANVMLQGGRALLTDFGLAKVAGMRSLTETGTALGTPQYMAPEQALGDAGELGPATDVYGLGATLFAMLTGEAPFPMGNVIEVMRAVVERPPRRPSELRRGLDPRLESICLRCLAKEPSARYASARRLAQALRRLEETPGARPGAGAARGRALPWALALVASGWGLGATLAWRDAESRLAALQAAPTPAPTSLPTSAAPSAPAETPAATPESAELRRFRDETRALAEAGDYEGVLRVASEGLALAPQDVQLLCRRAVAHYELGDAAGVRRDAEQALALSPETVDPWLAMAQAHLLAGDLEAGRDAVERALRCEPDDPYAHGMRGVIRAQQGDPRGGLEDLDLAVAGEPRNAISWLNRGRVRLGLGDMEGEQDLRQAYRLSPRNPQVLSALGNALNLLGDREEGLRFLDELVTLAPRDPQGWLDRGLARTDLGQLGPALSDFAQAIALEPSAVAYARRGVALLRMGRTLLGLGDLERALELDPDYVTAGVNRAIVYSEQGRVRDAIADLETVVSLPGVDPQQRVAAQLALERARSLPPDADSTADWLEQVEARPTDGEAFLQLGLCLEREQELALAEGAFDKAFSLGCRQPELYAYRAMVRAGLGRPGVEADLRQALDLQPDNPAALSVRGLLRLRQGDPRGAEDAERAVAVDPTCGRAFCARAMARADDDPAGAVADMTRAFELDGNHSYLYNRGLCLQKLQRLDEAQADYEAFLGRFPNFGDAWANLASIRLAQGDLEGGILAGERALELVPSYEAELRPELERARRRLAGR